MFSDHFLLIRYAETSPDVWSKIRRNFRVLSGLTEASSSILIPLRYRITLLPLEKSSSWEPLHRSGRVGFRRRLNRNRSYDFWNTPLIRKDGNFLWNTAARPFWVCRQFLIIRITGALPFGVSTQHFLR
jgi:hypothetical protein